MHFIDSHCHLDFKQFYNAEFGGDFVDNPKLQATIERAQAAKVHKIITIGCSIEESERGLAIAKNYDGVFSSAGVHPCDCDKAPADWASQIHRLAKENKEVVAIGETGLDFYHKKTSHEQQEPFFLEQISISKELGLPLVIHIRESAREVLDVLKREQVSNAVIHCFSADWAFAQECLDLGLHISFTGILTYPKATDIQEAAAKAPLEKIMIETDAPFLAPQKHRGQQNEPAYVVEVAEKLAELKGLSLEEVARQTTENAERFFQI